MAENKKKVGRHRAKDEDDKLQKLEPPVRDGQKSRLRIPGYIADQQTKKKD